ncbi:MAG: DJ-1/PfpI family protein [Pyrobaculum sp.]
MPNALIYVIDTAKKEEYSVLKNFLLKAGYDVRTAIGSRDVNVNYDIDLMALPVDEVQKLAQNFDLLATAGGFKMYYYVLKKKPPLKTWDLNIDVDKLEKLVEGFYREGRFLLAPLAVPAYVAQLGLLKGHDATVYPTTELIKILVNNGVNFIKKPIVKSKNVITIKDVTTLGEKEFLTALRETT